MQDFRRAIAARIRSLHRTKCGALALAVLLALPSGASSQTMGGKYPELFFEPTPVEVVERMLEVAKVTKDDYVFDLGSGDGRIPILAAARYGARGLGVEINPDLVEVARKLAKYFDVADRVEFRREDLFTTSVREATVVALYLFTWANVKLRPRLINELRPGSRIIAHDFPVGDWRPDIRQRFEDSTIYLWYVPAKVAGQWDLKGTSNPFSIRLQQRFQVIRGSATIDGRTVPLRNTKLRGDEIEFSVALDSRKPTLFRGRVQGDRMEPREQARGGIAGWSALRTTPAVPLDQPVGKERR